MTLSQSSHLHREFRTKYKLFSEDRLSMTSIRNSGVHCQMQRKQTYVRISRNKTQCKHSNDSRVSTFGLNPRGKGGSFH